MKKLIWLVLIIVLFVQTSCSEKPPATEETYLVPDKLQQVDIDRFLYGPQAIWEDMMVGIEYVRQGDETLEYYISTYNLRTRKKERALKLTEAVSSGLAIHGDRVVWASDGDIFLLNLETNKLRQITDDEYAQEHPVIYGDTIAWLDNRHNELKRRSPAAFNVYAYDLRTGKQRRLTSSNSAEDHSLGISGNIIVWTDKRHGDPEKISHAGNEPEYNNEIYLYDLGTNEERRITDYPGNDHNPAISGNRIVWLRQVEYVEADVFIYDLKTGQESRVSSSGYAFGIPDISGDLVAWTDAEISKGNTASDVIMNDQPGASDIHLFDLVTDIETKLASGSPDSAGGRWRVLDNPVIHGDFVVYTHSRQVLPIVYTITLDSRRSN